MTDGSNAANDRQVSTWLGHYNSDAKGGMKMIRTPVHVLQVLHSIHSWVRLADYCQVEYDYVIAVDPGGGCAVAMDQRIRSFSVNERRQVLYCYTGVPPSGS